MRYAPRSQVQLCANRHPVLTRQNILVKLRVGTVPVVEVVSPQTEPNIAQNSKGVFKVTDQKHEVKNSGQTMEYLLQT